MIVTEGIRPWPVVGNRESKNNSRAGASFISRSGAGRSTPYRSMVRMAKGPGLPPLIQNAYRSNDLVVLAEQACRTVWQRPAEVCEWSQRARRPTSTGRLPTVTPTMARSETPQPASPLPSGLRRRCTRYDCGQGATGDRIASASISMSVRVTPFPQVLIDKVPIGVGVALRERRGSAGVRAGNVGPTTVLPAS